MQHNSGNYKYAPMTKIFNKINNYSTNIANQVSHKIIEMAIQYKVDVVVFEHLSSNFKGNCGERRTYWCKKKIIHKVCDKIHLYGIRYATVNPKNTSALAFDGSGEVERNKNNYSLCKFTTGKQYNCDLNAFDECC